MLKVTVRRKKTNNLGKLFSKLKAIHNQSVSIGYFKEQGLHKDSDMPYANLLYIHAFGLVYGAPSRDIMSKIKPMLQGGASQKKFFKDVLKDYFKNKISSTQVFSRIGEKYRDDGRNVFGNPTMLEVTNNPTPLIDTGDLKNNFAYKTSITMEVVK